MLLALTDHLRCTASHAESWLVARADVVEDRRLVRGVLGCPVCGAERCVEGGVVWWEGLPHATAASSIPDIEGHALARVGALLGYGESLQPFALTAYAALAAHGLQGIADAPILLLDPPDDRAAPFATIIRDAPRVPMGASSCRGIVLDGAWATDSRAQAAVDVLANGGRMVAPVSVAVPAGVRELARDEQQWVAERVTTSVPIAIRRASNTP